MTAGAWALSLSRVFVLEILTCLHKDVFLKDISSKILALIIKILNGFNKHVLALVDHKGLGSHDVSLTTPPSSSKGTPSIAAAAQVISLDDLIRAVSDVDRLAAWIEQILTPLLAQTIFHPEGKYEVDEKGLIKNGSVEKISRCFDKQTTSILQLSPKLWKRIADMLTIDCRSGLKVGPD